jgi:hypothetical protein
MVKTIIKVRWDVRSVVEIRYHLFDLFNDCLWQGYFFSASQFFGIHYTILITILLFLNGAGWHRQQIQRPFSLLSLQDSRAPQA